MIPLKKNLYFILLLVIFEFFSIKSGFAAGKIDDVFSNKFITEHGNEFPLPKGQWALPFVAFDKTANLQSLFENNEMVAQKLVATLAENTIRKDTPIDQEDPFETARKKAEEEFNKENPYALSTQTTAEQQKEKERLLAEQKVYEQKPVCKGTAISRWSDCIGIEIFPNGDKYLGEFKYGRFNGRGKYYFLAPNQLEGNIFVGEFKDGMYNGLGIEYDKYGKVINSGKWKNSQIEDQFAINPNLFATSTIATIQIQTSNTSETLVVQQFEQERLLAEQKANEQLRLAEETRIKEQQRIAFEVQQKEQVRLAQEAKVKEQDRLLAEQKDKEQIRLAEERRTKEQQRLALEAQQKEQVRLAQEARQKEQERLMAEQQAKEQLRLAEETRIKNQQRLALESTEISRLRAEAEESKRKQAELEEQLRLAKQQNQVAPPSAMTTMANRKALVIGNDSYKSVSKLLNAREDAKAIAANLNTVGYQVTLKLDLNEKEMKAALRAFSSQVQGGDEVMFFFAGHGVQLGATNYLLPIDIGGESEAQVKDEAIQLQRILDDMSEKKSKFTLAMIDACRDNPFKTTGRAIGGRGMAPTTAATGQMVVFSAGTGQQALDRLGNNDKNKNGVFTRTFLKEMQKSGVSIDRIVKNVRNEVAELAKTVGHEQVPAIYDQVLGDFYFKK